MRRRGSIRASKDVPFSQRDRNRSPISGTILFAHCPLACANYCSAALMLEVIERLTTRVLLQQRTLCNIIASFLERHSGQLRDGAPYGESAKPKHYDVNVRKPYPLPHLKSGSNSRKGSFLRMKKRTYFEITPIVPSQVSTSSGHRVIGNVVGRNPKACLPSAYKCISTGTPAFFSAM